MKEQSHKSEMGAALRGDFERLRARRGATVDPGGAEAQAPAASPPEASPPEASPPEASPPEAPSLEASSLEPSRRSWLGRLRGGR